MLMTLRPLSLFHNSVNIFQVELGSMVIKKADIADTLLSLTGVEQVSFLNSL